MKTDHLEFALRAFLFLALATPLVVIPWVLYPFVFSKAIFFQTMVTLAVGLVLGFRLEWPRGIVRDPLVLAVAAFLLSAIISAALGVDPRRSFLGNEERSAGVLFVVYAAAFFFLVRCFFRDQNHWRNAGKAAVIFSGLLSAVAILQVFVFERSGIRLWGIDAGGRAAGFLGNPVYFGVFAPLAGVWTVFVFKREKIIWKIVALGSLAALMIADYLTLSRGAYLAMIAAVTVGLFVAGFVSRRSSARKAAVGIVVLVLASVAALLIFRGNSTVSGLPIVGPIVSSSFQSGTLGTRTLAWQVAIKSFGDRPFLGWGPDAFHLAFNAHYDPRFLEFSYYETWFDRAHNAFFDILVMQGAVGILTVGAAVLAVILALRRAITRGRFDAIDAGIAAGGLAGYAIAEMAAFDNPATMIYLAFILAHLSWIAWGEEKKVESADSKTKKISFRRFVVAAFPTLVIIAVVNVIPALVSARTREMAEIFGTVGISAGVPIFKELLGRWTIYPEESRVSGAMTLIGAMPGGEYTRERFDSEFPLIRRAIDELIKLHPRQAYYWYLRGRAFSEASRFDSSYLDEAEKNFMVADELSPNRQQIAYALGKHLLQTNTDRALSVLRRMVDLDPKVAQSHWYYGLALVNAGEEILGQDELVRAGELSYDPQTIEEALLLRELFLRRGWSGMVAKYAQKVVDMEPTAARFAEAAAAYAAIGDDESARKSVKKAVEIDPSYAGEAEAFLSLLESGALLSPTSTP